MDSKKEQPKGLKKNSEMSGKPMYLIFLGNGWISNIMLLFP